MAYTSQYFTTTSPSTNTYTLLRQIQSANDLIVVVNGLVLIPNTDYNIFDTSITFIDIPPVGSDVEIRYLDTTIQGLTGYKGSSGETGFTGSTGSGGNTGYTGSTGFDGSLGYTGSEGIQGYVGSKGDVGAQGPAGGYTGSTGAGAPTTNQLIVSAGVPAYTLTQPVDNPLRILVIVNGLIYTPLSDYSVSGNILTFVTESIPPSGSDIEIRYFDTAAPIGYQGSLGFEGSIGAAGFTGSEGQLGGIGYTGSRGAGFTGSTGAVGAPDYSQQIISDGTITYTMDRYVSNETHIIVSVNGLVQIPITDYTVNNTSLNFTSNSIPPSGSDIEIRFFSIADQVGYSGSQGYFGSIGFTGSGGSLGFQGSVGITGLVEVYVANTAPTGDLAKGELWWDNDDGILSIYYNDEITWVGVGEGFRGPVGYDGSLGYTGSIGSGYSGSVGDKGYTGSTGTGYTGSVGSTGYSGSIGVIGYTGSLNAPSSIVDELIEPVSTAGISTININCSYARLFDVTGYTGPLTINLYNLGLGNNRATNIVLILHQTSTAIIPTIKVEGNSVTPTWQGGNAANPSLGRTEFLSLSIVKIAFSINVYAQLISFG